ncbi:MAG: S24 family peptidase [Calditrichia bacterium]
MGKQKGHAEKSGKTAAGEECFRLPRAEFLVEAVQDNPERHLADLITNEPCCLSGRATLQVEDDAMQGAGMQAGDFVVVQEQDAYEYGSIVAVQLGNRTLVRRFSHAAGRHHLHCDPPSRQVLIVEEHTPDFRILGQVVQLIKEIK